MDDGVPLGLKIEVWIGLGLMFLSGASMLAFPPKWVYIPLIFFFVVGLGLLIHGFVRIALI